MSVRCGAFVSQPGKCIATGVRKAVLFYKTLSVRTHIMLELFWRELVKRQFNVSSGGSALARTRSLLLKHGFDALRI